MTREFIPDNEIRIEVPRSTPPIAETPKTSSQRISQKNPSSLIARALAGLQSRIGTRSDSKAPYSAQIINGTQTFDPIAHEESDFDLGELNDPNESDSFETPFSSVVQNMTEFFQNRSKANIGKAEIVEKKPLSTFERAMANLTSKRQKRAEEKPPVSYQAPNFKANIWNDINYGLATMNAGAARIPATLYDVAAIPQNKFFKSIGMPDQVVKSPEWALSNPFAKYYENAAKHYNEKSPMDSFEKALKKKDPKRIANHIARSVIRNAPQQVATIAFAAAGVAGAGLAFMGSSSAAEANKEARERGIDPEVAATNALINGVIEAGFENIGTMGLFKTWQTALTKDFGKKATGKIIADSIKAIFYSAFGEGNEEFWTSIGQDASAFITGSDKNALEGMLLRAVEAATVGAASGASMTAPSAIGAGYASAKTKEGADREGRLDRLASEKERTKLAAVTQTPEFKPWFGDSKVVDGNGNPLVVHHVTNEKFNTFNPDMAAMGGMFWFTSDKSKIDNNETGAGLRPGKEKNVVNAYLSIQKMAGWAEYEKYGIGELKGRGYDGIKLDDNYVVFDNTQIKSVDNRGTFDPKDPDIRHKLAGNSPVFFSQLEKTIEQKMPNVTSPEQVRGILANSGVKKEEMDWLDVERFLTNKQFINKQEFLEYLRANDVKVEEVVKSGTEDDHYNALSENKTPKSPTKFHSYQLPGGENYRELLLTLPTQGKITYTRENTRLTNMHHPMAKFQDDARFWYIEAPGQLFQILKSKHATAEAALEYVIKEKQPEPPADKNFKSSHFEEPNILAHVRFNERTDSEGKRVLFIEEIQSDWHQAGRKKGYGKSLTTLPPSYKVKQESDSRWVVLDANEIIWGDQATKEEAIAEAIELIHRPDARGDGVAPVPDAPFKKTWHELALKRMLRYATENGFDKIAWTTGEQQAERYDLSKQIDSVQYYPDTQRLIAVKNGDPVINRPGTKPEELENYIGKDVAKRLVESKTTLGTGDRPYHSLSGLELKVGGEGMKGFYDQIIPSFLNKYTKKWGGKVSKTNLSQEAFNTHISKSDAIQALKDGETVFAETEDGGEYEIETRDDLDAAALDGNKFFLDSDKKVDLQVHSLDITPSMKESVLDQGQPLFRRPTMDELKFGLSEEEIQKRQKRGMEFLQKYLPEIARYVKNPWLLSTKAGLDLLGSYIDGVIEVRKDQPLPIYKHEAGHAFFDLFVSNESKIKYLDAVRRAYSKRVAAYAKENSVSEDRAAEEILMELAEKVDAKDYVYDGKSIPAKIILFLKETIRRIRAFFNSDKAQIEKFFTDFYQVRREVNNQPGFKPSLRPNEDLRTKLDPDSEEEGSPDEILTPEDEAYLNDMAKTSEYEPEAPAEFITDEQMKQNQRLENAKDTIVRFAARQAFMKEIGKFKRFKGGFMREELSGIKDSFFTSSEHANTLDEVADELGVDTDTLISQLTKISETWDRDLADFRIAKKTLEEFDKTEAAKLRFASDMGRRVNKVFAKEFRQFKKVIAKRTGMKDLSDPVEMSEKEALKIKMKAQVQAAKYGFREGVRSTRERFLTAMAAAKDDQKARREALKAYIAENAPEGLKRDLTAQANKIQTDSDLVRAFARVDDIIQKTQKKAVIEEIKSLFKKADNARNIAVEYKELIQALEDEIEFKGKRADTVERLRKTQAWIDRKMKAGEPVDLPKRIYDALKGLGKTPLRDYELNDLVLLYDKLDTLFSLGELRLQNRRSAFIAERGQIEKELLGAPTQAVQALDLKPRPIRGGLSAGDTAINLFRQTINKLQSIDLNISPMDVIFDMFDKGAGYSGAWYRTFKRTNDVNFSNFLNEAWEFKDDLKKTAERLKLNNDSYRAIGVWAALQQKDGYEKLINNGYTEKELKAVSLSAKEKEFYAYMRKNLDALKPRLKDLMATVHNRELGDVTNYFPFMTDFDILNELEAAQRIFDQEERAGLQREPNMKFTIERKGAGKQKIKINAYDVYLNHMENALYALHMDYNLKMLSSVMDSKDIQKKLGERGTTIIKQWLDVMAKKGGVSGQQQIRFLDILRHNYGVATLGFKLSSALVQPTALLDGAAIIGDYAFRGAAAIATNPGMRKIVSQMPEVKERVGDDPAFQEKTGFKLLDAVQSAGLKPLKVMDGMTAASIAAGAYMQFMDRMKLKIDPNNPNEDAIQYAQLIVRRSQSTSSFKDTPLAVSRGKIVERFENRSVARMFTQFQTYMLNRWSWMRHDFPEDLKNQRWVPAATKVAFLNAALLTEVMVRNLSKGVIQAIIGGDDDEEEKSFLNQYLMSATQTVPFVSQAIGSAYYSSLPLPTLQFIYRLMDNQRTLSNSTSPKARRKWGNIALTESVGGLVGLPGTMQLSQILRKEKIKKSHGY